MPAKKEDNPKKKEVVEKGDIVTIEYEGKLDDGTLFDSSIKRGQPLDFQVGVGQVIPGFENAMLGMKKGEEKEIKITPEQGYGQPNPELVRDMPKSELPEPEKLKAGSLLVVQLPNGMKLPVKITKVAKETVTVDLNHPLAGKNLNFKINLLDIKEPEKMKEPTKEELFE
jgi:FKBP-type peptidyl-prolyl cis-trans isomerase 2